MRNNYRNVRAIMGDGDRQRINEVIREKTELFGIQKKLQQIKFLTNYDMNVIDSLIANVKQAQQNRIDFLRSQI